MGGGVSGHSSNFHATALPARISRHRLRRRFVSPTREIEELKVAGIGSKLHDLSFEVRHLIHRHAVGLADDGDHSNNLYVTTQAQVTERDDDIIGQDDRLEGLLAATTEGATHLHRRRAVTGSRRCQRQRMTTTHI